jgi:hypothetical protein
MGKDLAEGIIFGVKRERDDGSGWECKYVHKNLAEREREKDSGNDPNQTILNHAPSSLPPSFLPHTFTTIPKPTHSPTQSIPVPTLIHLYIYRNE